MDVKIARTAGFCWGVRRTVDQVMQVADQAVGQVVTLGPIIHNPQAVARMRDKGVGTVNAIAEVDAGTTVTVSLPIGTPSLTSKRSLSCIFCSWATALRSRSTTLNTGLRLADSTN